MAKNLCSTNMPNGGAPECDKSKMIPRVIVVGMKKFSPAEYATQAAFKTAFKNATLLSRYDNDKLIVLPIIQNVENTTEQNTVGTFNQGRKENLREGAPAFNFLVKMSARQAQMLRALNNQDVRVFVGDSAKMCWGNVDSDANFQGDDAQVWVNGDNFTDGQNPKATLISLTYNDPDSYYDEAAYVEPSFDIKDYGKLKDVVIYEKVAAAANVFNLSGKILTGKAGGALDIYTDFAAAMAAGGNWIATNKTTGAVIAITSVAQNAGGYWVFTLDAAAWGALAAGTQVGIRWAAPSVLDAANVTGVESVELVVAKP